MRRPEDNRRSDVSSVFFDDPAIRPDEMKIYPCSLIADTELYDRWLAGEYHTIALDRSDPARTG